MGRIKEKAHTSRSVAGLHGNLRLRVLIEPDEDGVFVAWCPTLPGCVSQGNTRGEAQENIKDAIKGYIESLRKSGDPIPPPISEEVVEVNV